jgi:HEAT repeat protein
MLDATTKKLLRLLAPDRAESLRCAAALVLGEVGTRDAELNEALCQAVDDPSPLLRMQALDAVGKLRIEQALPRVLARVANGGAEGEMAAIAAARLGARGIRALQELMPKVAPGLRRRIAAALAAAGTTSAETAALDALLDKDPGVVDAAAASLSAEIPRLSAAHRKGLTDHLLELLKQSKKSPLSPASETAVLRLLAALDDPRAEPIFWDRTQPPHPPEIRAAALQALGKRAVGPSREQLRRLFACAADADFRVAAPALMMLKAVPVSPKSVAEWLPLLDAPDVAVRRLAIEKVGGQDTKEVAEALLRQLHHPDRTLRGEAIACLAKLEQGRKALTDALLKTEAVDDAWTLARAQTGLVRDYPPALRKQLLARACTYLEEGDRRADALLFLLRDADHRELRDRLEERALALRKKKDYATALIYLRLLGRDSACGAAVRMELAGCGLKASAHDLSAEARSSDPCLQQFAGLIHTHEAELLDFVTKAKWLDADDLFYVGFHFAEQKERAERNFGAAALRLVVKRSPRSKLAKDARAKLGREGLE